ncbi:peptidyl-prolyl cis-trans isomerase [Deinococcus sp. Arct2-2]|uniref:peptidylprolyl isomerase n=1 Tax=Deinococcus sp. Arct2-2 TaxID=2568653 RepID=UPI0010A45AC7|nr:peptidylprolyl isomerase [Deinococcus sp. Arct2-2]THF71826.1 peptidyl-prolyl cis-trans isomerase [Deinococcus sp. Arct2-2]
MKNKKFVNVLLGVLALMLVVGMAYQFTPNLGSLFNRQTGTPALKVNGQTITVEELEALRRGNPVLSSTDTGLLGDDFKTYVVAQKARQVLYIQAAEDINVSKNDVNAEVTKVREQNKLTDNKAWTDALQGAGLTDAAFRKQVRDGLAVQRKVDSIKATATPATDAEAQLYYTLNQANFVSDARIVGRQIVAADEAKAKSLLAQVKAGGDFAALATANSTENKDRGGALGPLENGAPRPVAQVALPAEVGTAAFALTEGGVTDVIKSGGKFYIVKVEKFLAPAPKPFADAKTDVLTAVNQQKKNAAVEAWGDKLAADMKVEYIDVNWKAEDPTVAKVAGQNIPYSAVIEQVVGNQQFTGLLQQVPADQAAQLVNGILKPQVVQSLIQGYAARKVAQDQKLALAGTRQELAASLAAYGARDVKVTDADVQKYYQENIKQFETAASGTVNEASFKDKAQAVAFRNSWNGSNFTQAATKAGGTVSERGAITGGTESTLGAELKAAIFTAKTLKTAGEGSLSDVVQVGTRYSVAYVTDLKRAATQPLSAVRSQIEEAVLGTKKNEVGSAFVAKQVAALKPTDNLKTILAAQEKRVTAATPKPATPATPAPGTPATPATGTETPATGTPATETPATETPATETPAETP